MFLSSLCIQIKPSKEQVQVNGYYTDPSLQTHFVIPESSACCKRENVYVFTGGYVYGDGFVIGGTNIVYEVFPFSEEKESKKEQIVNKWKIEKSS